MILRILLILLGLVLLLVGVLVVEAFLASRGQREDFKNPSPEARIFGTGQPLRYTVIGDSTGAGQGAPYDSGIAVGTATELSKDRAVSLQNFSVSGAQTKDVLRDQVEKAAATKPDIVLIAVGGNDVTHLAGAKPVRRDLDKIVNALIAANCDVKIVLTGSPDLGGARRLAQPLRWILGERTKSLNHTFEDISRERGLTFAYLARETGPIFRRDKTLLAEDRFHPNEEGYDIWIPVLNRALTEAKSSQKSHCEVVR